MELADETMTDHLLQAFSREDGIGSDGQAHEEGKPLTCLCGLVGADSRELDAHFLAVFAPPDAIGRDGKKHALAAARDGD